MSVVTRQVMNNWQSSFLCGVDEAGRGPWAGPVVAAAGQLKPGASWSSLPGLGDSKALSSIRRAKLVPLIQANCHWAVGIASPEEIDQLNILQATFLAMRRALRGVAQQLAPDTSLVIDGSVLPDLSEFSWPAQTLVKADSLVPAVSAASVLAKEHRDALMRELDIQYPGYGFAKHSGYGVPAHAKALSTLGPCAAHRKSFAPVRNALAARDHLS